MPLSKDLSALLTEADTPADFGAWLEKEGILTPPAFALLAATEEKVDDRIVKPAVAGGVKLESLKANVSIAQAWVLARAAMNRDSDIRSGRTEVRDDEPLSEHVRTDLDAAWYAKHRFHLSSARKLTDSLMGSMFRQIHGSPTKLNVLLPEQMRTQACMFRKSGTQVVVTPGEQLRAQTVVADEVRGVHDLYVRLRAWFSTVAFVSINKDGFFSLADAETHADQIQEFLHQTFDGQRPPVAFYCSAWARTIQRFTEDVKTNKMTLQQSAQCTSGGHHFWTLWTPPTNGPSVSSNQAQPQPRMSNEMETEMKRLKDLTKTLQSQKDTLEHQLRERRRSRSRDRKRAGQNNNKKGNGRGSSGSGKPQGGKRW